MTTQTRFDVGDDGRVRLGETGESPELLLHSDRSAHLERVSSGSRTTVRTHTCPLCGCPREGFEGGSFSGHLSTHNWSDLPAANRSSPGEGGYDATPTF